MGYTKMEDWYKIDREILAGNYGAGFLKKFGNSPRAAVSGVFQEHAWEKEKFGRIGLVFSQKNVKKTKKSGVT